MKFSDILKLSIDNLRRRKWRTVLTVLGVTIGTISVVLMLSLGFGLKETLNAELNMGGTINDIVIEYQGEDVDMYLTDSKIEEFKELSQVAKASPQLQVALRVNTGKYESTMWVSGVSQEDLEKIPLGQGVCPKEGEEFQIIVGNMLVLDFWDAKTGECPYWDNNVIPEIDMMNDRMYASVINYDAYDGVNIDSAMSKRKQLKIAGVVEGDPETYNAYSYSTFVEIETLKDYLEKEFRGKRLPEQPVDKNGNPYKEWIYPSVKLTISDTVLVEDTATYFRDMGYRVTSQKEWIEENNKVFDIVQLVLGGIGAVSLLVAAIGITNTITMSTYERRKEIGVMKVLGCDIENIGAMFVSEAGFIGFLGGAVGVLISYLLSKVVNIVGASFMTEAIGVAGNLSAIPLWLPFVAVGFTVLVGVVAGYFPARKATRISALAAIRND
ncbi:MAG: ABC transporter permease [Lachnospiraceae bacterium]|nr:ABC transporter permease [Lachnospiraceae bacterium]